MQNLECTGWGRGRNCLLQLANLGRSQSHLLEIQLPKSTQSRDLLKEFGAVSESVHFRRNSTSCQESSTDLVEGVTKIKRPPDKLRMGTQGSGKRWGRMEMWVLTGLILGPDGDICASLPCFLFRGCLLPKCKFAKSLARTINNPREKTGFLCPCIPLVRHTYWEIPSSESYGAKYLPRTGERGNTRSRS